VVERTERHGVPVSDAAGLASREQKVDPLIGVPRAEDRRLAIRAVEDEQAPPPARETLLPHRVVELRLLGREAFRVQTVEYPDHVVMDVVSVDVFDRRRGLP
jgi:hypothetical protein